MKVGDKFISYEDFSGKLDLYKTKVFNDFWIRDSRTIDLQRKRHPSSVPGNTNNKLMVYYYLRIACIKGGRAYTPRNKIKVTSTLRQNCPAGMFVKLTPCGSFLEIKELEEEHTHPVNESLFKSLPQQRLKIPAGLKMNSIAALQTRANKNIIENHIINESGCLVTLKDLSKKPHTRKKFEECVTILKETYKCEVELCTDEKANLQCLYFQDAEMKQMFDSYPEIIFVDGTYCLHSSRAATYFIMVEDAEGNGEIVACGVLMTETEENIDWFIKTFKKLNGKASEITVVMSDKDNKERTVFKENFPNASLQICLFHTLQIFNREISVLKMDLSSKECNIAKEYLQKLAYATSEEVYGQVYAEMRNNVPQVIIDYYEKNWEPIKDEWVLYLTFGNLSFLKQTNNRVESINAKLKSVISKFPDLEVFIKNFFIVLNSLRVDRNIRKSKQFHKVTTKVFAPDSAECLYSKFLTNFAFKKVEEQLIAMEFCKDFQFIDEEKCLFPTREGLLEVTTVSCECLFWTSIKLPCQHIFKVRSICNKPLYEEGICLNRWRRSYFQSTLPFSSGVSIPTENATCISEKRASVNLDVHQQKRRPLTNHQKFKIMNEECLKLSQVCSETSSEIFYKRLEFIKYLAIKWSSMPQSCEFQLEDEEPSRNNIETSVDDDIEEIERVVSPNSENFTEVTIKSFQYDDTEGDTNSALLSDLPDNQILPETSSTEVNVQSSRSSLSLSDVKVPVVKTRRRPRGSGNTVIGLKRKKLK